MYPPTTAAPGRGALTEFQIRVASSSSDIYSAEQG
jgi:hypothetical protein